MDGTKNIIKIKETDGYNKLYIINYSEAKNNCKKLIKIHLLNIVINIKTKFFKIYLVKKYIFFICSFLILLILVASRINIILHQNNYNFYEKENNIILNNKSIYNSDKIEPYNIAFNNGKKFIENNIKGILINKEKIFLTKKPKISAVIPCHNCQKYILRAIRSIQNQNFSDFEIIIANDFSTDNTLAFLKKLKNEDSRIRIINNKKNMGTLYTRTIGSLSANGKYIYPIDSDDMFLDSDIFYVITNIAEKSNFDITIFNSINVIISSNGNINNIRIPHFERRHKPNLILMQPELGYYPIQPSENYKEVYYYEVYIFAKCIKASIYKKAFNKLGIEKYSRHMILDEDLIANYILFNTAEILKYIPKFGYLYIDRPGSGTKLYWNNTTLLLYKIYVLDDIIEFAKDVPKNKRILVYYIIHFLQLKFLKTALNKSHYINKIFNSCLDRILNCKYISEEDKNKIRIFGKGLDFINYKF